MERTVTIKTEYINLDALLKLAGLTGTGGEAKLAIQDGAVRLNGAVEIRRTKKIYPGDVVFYQGDTITVRPSNQGV